jgi:hypothetical protein
MTRNILLSYYAATVVFLLLDYVFGINVRLAFIEESVSIRAGYYLFCFACFALMIWRPAWTVVIGAVESLITLVAIIVHMALRVMVPTDQMVMAGQGLVTLADILNFMLAGGIAYISWVRGMRELSPQLRL